MSLVKAKRLKREQELAYLLVPTSGSLLPSQYPLEWVSPLEYPSVLEWEMASELASAHLLALASELASELASASTSWFVSASGLALALRLRWRSGLATAGEMQ